MYKCDNTEKERIAAEYKEKAVRLARYKAHRAKIGQEAISGLMCLDLTEKDAANIFEAIDQGAIPHITVNY
jgi:hypothetical protein